MRYYEQRYPEVDELVMVQVRQIAEMGAYVKLVCASYSSLLAPSGRVVCGRKWCLLISFTQVARVRQH